MDTLTAQRSPQAANGSAGAEAPAAPDGPGPAQAPLAARAPEPAPAAPLHTCARCGSPMAAGQDWCLHCGSGAPSGLGTPGWRSTAALAAAAGVLVLAAGGVGYAALAKGPRRAAVITRTVAQVAPPAAATPPPVTTPAPTPKAALPATPSIPSTPVVPAAKAPVPAVPPVTTPTTPQSPPGKSEEAPTGEPLVLDTNAASTYNPSTLPVGSFGDPTLAIDGDPATGWTALVEPAAAPKMAAGLLLDLKSAQHVATIELITSTPGMTVQVYGTSAEAAPATITDPAWKKLTRATLVHKRHAKLTVRGGAAHSYRFILLWISRAPAASVGTPQKPGHVSVNELELFPPHH